MSSEGERLLLHRDIEHVGDHDVLLKESSRQHVSRGKLVALAAVALVLFAVVFRGGWQQDKVSGGFVGLQELSVEEAEKMASGGDAVVPAAPAAPPAPADAPAASSAPPADAPPPAAAAPAAPPADAPSPGAAAPADAPKPAAKPAATNSTDKPDDAKLANCAAAGEDCSKKGCCKEPGNQCFRKSKFWAECRTECEKGKHLTDPDSTPWTCDPIGEKTPGSPHECAKDGEDCRKTKCCKEPGTTCYEKAEFWAACKPSCTPGPDLMAPDSDSWTCKELGPRTPGAAPWVAEECAQTGEQCDKQGCCAAAGHQCYKKDDWYSTCMPAGSCTPGFKENEWDTAWACDTIGPVTPRSNDPSAQPQGQVAMWVADKCKSEGENCLESKCCKSVGWQCFTKNKYWAQCGYECPPVVAPAPPAAASRRLNATRRFLAADPPAKSADPPADDAAWECAALGPKSWGLSIKGHPSLYCVTLFVPSSYEGAIMNKQLEMDAGIFSCDGYDVIASDDVTLGSAKDGTKTLVKTRVIEKVEVGVSQDGTAGNAKLFMAFWDSIIAGKRFRDYDWTLKVDADAVLIAWRMRDHMRPHIGESVYVVNCNKYPSSPNFPMMYGSVEIFSSAAMIAYAEGSWKCGQDLPWGGWGEDYYMTHCLDYLGVGRISDFSVVGDGVCTGANCADGSFGSFHPFKTPEDWVGCWNQAVPPA